MRISQKLDYACRAITFLSKGYDGKSVTKLDEISEKEVIPSSFLVQILKDLKNAGLVTSKRGKAGGYLLSRRPEAVRLADVINAVEPQWLEEVDSIEGQSAAQLERAWGELSEVFKAKANEITFDQLITGDKEPMWFI